jgi:hypothetical protein
MERFFVWKSGRKDRQKENGKQKIHFEIYHPNGVSPLYIFCFPYGFSSVFAYSDQSAVNRG